MHKNQLLILVGLILVSSLQAIEPSMYFKHITTDEGLRSNNVSAVIQDDLGFIWFGTQEGLSRYDGHSFVNFSHLDNDSSTLSNSIVTSMIKDGRGNLWVGTRSGLNYFDLTTYTITRMPSSFDKSLGSLAINYMCIAHNDILYVSTTTNGLYSINLKNNELLKHYKHNANDSSSLIDNNISGIAEDNNRRLWIGTHKGLDLLDTTNDSFTHYFTQDNKAIRALSLNKDGQLVFSPIGKEGFYTICDDSLSYKAGVIEKNNGDNKMLFYTDRKENTWIALRDIGLVYQDKSTNESILMSYEKDKPYGISSNTLNNIFEDRDGNMWLSTYEEGVNFLDINRKKFMLLNEDTHPEVENQRIRCLYTDSDNEVWIGSKICGILSNYKRATNSFVHYRNDENNPESLGDDYVFCIMDASPGYLWVGTSHKGLRLFDKNTGTFTSPTIKSGFNSALHSNSIYALEKDKNSRLWIGTGYNGLFIYDTKKLIAKQYMHPSKKYGGISNSKIRAIYRDKLDNMWIGTVYGLNLYHWEEDSFSVLLHDMDNPLSISNNEITCLFEDSKNRFWVGTKKGLNLMDRTHKTFKQFTDIDILSNSIISGIQEDGDGKLWISSSQGLSTFDLDSMSIRNYSKEDGLQGVEFANNAYCKTKNGELYFGGNKGLNIFDPKEIRDNKIKPRVAITKFKISNQEVTVSQDNSPLAQHITQTHEITLDYTQNSFTFEYIALNYSSSSKNTYQYMMQGFNKEWLDVEHKREATYTNMDPGNYVFKVKASNNDGLWNNAPTTITINILPPPWKTWWAYISYLIIFSLLVIRMRLYFINKIKTAKEHELDQQKLNFFINVSHEFRTPISLIINPIDKLLNNYDPNNSKDDISTIHQSAHKLSNIVNQLLDYRRMEFGKLPLKATKIDVVAFTEKAVQLFVPLASSQDIKLSFASKASSINAWVDHDKYEKILNNLISNAIKFSHAGDSVHLSLSLKNITESKTILGFPFSNKTQKQVFEIRVIDTGVGIEEEHQKMIFDRFYSSSNDYTSTGIGLNYTKGLVELHHGNIKVKSSLGKGSEFTVQLPISNKHLRKDQIIHSSSANTKLANTSYIESLKYELNTRGESTDNIVDNKKENRQQQTQLIYIVEDNKTLREQLKNELKQEYKVKGFSNGYKAYTQLKDELPDLVISDIMMPEMDGIELCQKLKTGADTSHIPVVLLTAKTLVEHRIKGYEIGADDYISKPFNMYELKLRVKNILELRKSIKDKFINADTLMNVSKVASNNKDEAFLDKVLKISLEHISDPDFTINELQKKVGIGRSSFYHKVSSLSNMPPSLFLNTIRIKHATELLVKNEHSVKEISYMCGFSSPSYFNKVFRKILDKTPLQYIEENS